MTSPTPPNPGVDCFPMRYCSDGSVYCTAHGTETPSAVDDDRAVQVFLDADGYVWLVVMEYELTTGSTVVPHWVWIFKSVNVIDCDEITAGGTEGWQLDGTGTYGTFELVSEGVHKDADACASEDAPLLNFDAANLFVRFFKNRGSCCAITDPCNPTPLDACGPYETVECYKCAYDLANLENPDNLAPGALLVEITAASSWPGSPYTCSCSGLVGSYVVPWCCEGLGVPCLFVVGGCSYQAEFDLDPDVVCDYGVLGDVAYVKLILTFQLYQLTPGSGASLDIIGGMTLVTSSGAVLSHTGSSSVVSFQSCTGFSDVPMGFVVQVGGFSTPCGSIVQGCTVTMTVSPIT